MKPLALGLIADLRRRRLLPIAVLLLVALVAVPVVLREPEAAPAPSPVPEPAAETVPGGLPSPGDALAGQPLVTMASLETSSALRSFDSRDPFRPLQSMGEMAAGDGAGGDAGGVPLGDVGSADLSSGAFSAAAGGGDPGGFGDSGDVTGGGGLPAPTTPELDPEQPEPDVQGPTPEPSPAPSPEPDPGTFAIDVSFAGPEQAREIRGLPRLAMLPHASVPLLIFLGVSDGGKEAMFLVDSKLVTDEGEGTCRPSVERCATLGLEPGERQTFVDAEGRGYVLQLDQIREISVEQAIKRRRAADARVAQAQQGAPQPAPAPQRFLPVLVDIFS